MREKDENRTEGLRSAKTRRGAILAAAAAGLFLLGLAVGMAGGRTAVLSSASTGAVSEAAADRSEADVFSEEEGVSARDDAPKTVRPEETEELPDDAETEEPEESSGEVLSGKGDAGESASGSGGTDSSPATGMEEGPFTGKDPTHVPGESWMDVTEAGFSSLEELTGEKAVRELGGYELPRGMRDRLNEMILKTENEKHDVGFIMLDIRTGKGIVYNAEQEFYSASSIKGLYVISLAAEKKDLLKIYGNICRSICVNSDNGAYSSLLRTFGSTYYNQWCTDAGADAGAYLGLPRAETTLSSEFVCYTAEEMARLWLRSYPFLTGSEYGEEVGDLLETPGRSVIHAVLGESWTTQSKAGWINENLKSTVDAGIVYAGDHPYVVVILTDIGDDMKKMEPYIEQLELVHQDMTGEIPSDPAEKKETKQK